MGQGSLSAWTETVLLTIAFIGVLSLVVAGFNGMYNQDYQIGLGTNSTASEDFKSYQDQATDAIEGGEADLDGDNGITLRTSWSITKRVFSIVASFVTGGFIEEAFSYTNLGEAGQMWAVYLRILYFISLVFAILYILFKVIA